MEHAPSAINFSFLLLTGFLLMLTFRGLRLGLHRAGLPMKNLLIAYVAVGAWLAITAVLSGDTFFGHFDVLPPRFPLIPLIPIISIIILMNTKWVNTWVDAIPASWLIYPQTFRLPMEIILWWLFLDQVIPIQMTFEGYNFDVLVALTAPIIGWYLFKNNGNYKLGIAWNIGGMALLATIVTIAVLSLPLPIRQFTNEPANRIVAYWPFIWLPGFVVPFALLLHLLSIKKLLRENSK